MIHHHRVATNWRISINPSIIPELISNHTTCLTYVEAFISIPWRIRFNFLPYSSAKKTGSSFASVLVSNYVITLFGKRLMFLHFVGRFLNYTAVWILCTKGCTLLNNEIGLRTRLCAWSIKSSHTRWDLLPENHAETLGNFDYLTFLSIRIDYVLYSWSVFQTGKCWIDIVSQHDVAGCVILAKAFKKSKVGNISQGNCRDNVVRQCMANLKEKSGWRQ